MNTEHTWKRQNYIMGQNEKKRRHRFLFGVLLSALLITGALYGREYDISQLKNIEVMETLSSAVSQFGGRQKAACIFGSDNRKKDSPFI